MMANNGSCDLSYCFTVTGIPVKKSMIQKNIETQIVKMSYELVKKDESL